MSNMVRIGVRELKQRASEWLRRVEAGETLEVASRGRPVALLIPIPKGDTMARLEAEGRLAPAREDLLSLGPPLRAKRGVPLPSTVLEELRAEER
jgi:prevent-host-death family protein